VKVLDFDYSDHRPIAMEVQLPQGLAYALNDRDPLERPITRKV